MRRSVTGRWILGEVRDGSEDARGCLGRVGELSGGPGRVGGPTRRYGTGQGTHLKVWDGLTDPPEGPGRVGGLTKRSETGWWTIPQVRDGSKSLPVVHDGLGDPRVVQDGS